MKYKEYIKAISDKIRPFLCDTTQAEKLAIIGRGLYYNEKTFTPIEEVVIFILKKIPITELSDAGIVRARHEYKINRL